MTVIEGRHYFQLTRLIWYWLLVLMTVLTCDLLIIYCIHYLLVLLCVTEVCPNDSDYRFIVLILTISVLFVMILLPTNCSIERTADLLCAIRQYSIDIDWWRWRDSYWRKPNVWRPDEAVLAGNLATEERPDDDDRWRYWYSIDGLTSYCYCDWLQSMQW